MNIGIYVVAHKKYNFFPQNYPYKVIQVNAKKNGHDNFASLYDDVGDNISAKNNNYCELSALYWLWKNNLQEKYIGLTHYRRYFCFSRKNKFLAGQFVINPNDKIFIEKNINITDIDVTRVFAKNDIILPLAQYCNSGLRLDYYENHIKKDFLILENVVKECYPDYGNSFDKVMSGHKFYCYNMFISKRDFFDKYMEWLFSILFNVENRIEISSDQYQARVFGFMAERLFNLYIYHNRLKIIEFPIVYLDENIKHAFWKRKSYRTIMSELGMISWY
jgi:hypothetical protein